MKVLVLCGVFAEINEVEVMENATKMVEFSANIFQRRLINGLKSIAPGCDVVSAPFIGSYPNASRIRIFRGFSVEQNEYRYVSFDNLWGVRNFSRASALKKEIKTFAMVDDSEKLIVVYSPHTPFLEAAVYAKRIDPRIKICLLVPDLPQYMNLNTNISVLYRVGKKYDIAKFHNLSKWIDSYVLLTEKMREPLSVGNRPYIVVEGIVDLKRDVEKAPHPEKDSAYKNIVYTGKMNRRFGVCCLVDAFMKMTDPAYRLILCGTGDAQEYVQECLKKDPRICYLGQVSYSEAKNWISKADVLVNPRPNNEEYTKYSFPSKNIEYLMSGNPTVAYMLDGIPDIYSQFLYVVQGDEPNELKQAIFTAMSDSKENKSEKSNKAKAYLGSLSGEKVAKKILRLNFGENILG